MTDDDDGVDIVERALAILAEEWRAWVAKGGSGASVADATAEARPPRGGRAQGEGGGP